ncbi:MAG: hypothetical protein ABL962_14340 [Fimbriimonadaceae bacterium]
MNTEFVIKDFGYVRVGDDRDLLWFAVLDDMGLLALLTNPAACVREIGKRIRRPLTLGSRGYVLTFHGRPAIMSGETVTCVGFTGTKLAEAEYKVSGVSGTGFLTVEGLIGDRQNRDISLASSPTQFEGVVGDRIGSSGFEGALHATLPRDRDFIGRVMFCAITQRGEFLRWIKDGEPTIRQVDRGRLTSPKPTKVALADDFFLVLSAPNNIIVPLCAGAPGSQIDDGTFRIAGLIQKLTNPKPTGRNTKRKPKPKK